MKICKNCILPESFPGISFDEHGQCTHCAHYKGRDNQEKLKHRYKQKFFSIIKEIKEKGPYDVLMAYSGGKDSTYTLRLLKESFNLKILAITFDHRFISSTAWDNIYNVIDALDIDHLTIRPGAKTLCSLFIKSIESDIYPMKALERASAICNSCMYLVKSFMLKTAIEKKIPLIAYGWSPGQAPVQSSVFKTNPLIISQMQKAMIRSIQKMIGESLSAFFLNDHHLEIEAHAKSFNTPYLVHPLAFMDYNGEIIFKNIRELNWTDPKDTDANSTNCLLNGFANEIHIKQYGFHPYAFEIAALVREGYMTRDEGLKKIFTPTDPNIVNYVKTKLGIITPY